MWIVKLGGSLNLDPLLPEWLTLCAQLGGGRVVVVCGGGGFADEVRRAQTHWQFDDLAAHNMAVLAMAQSAHQAHGLCPALPLASSDAALRQHLRSGRAALWLPFDQLAEQPTAHTCWEYSADSIALALALRLNAERLVLVKSCAIAPAASLAELAAVGVLDEQFAQLAGGAAFPIELLERSQTGDMRAQLLGGSGPPQL